MRAVCCCDEECNQRHDVLETLCGLRIHAYVVAAAVRVQSVARGRLLRCDKRAFEKAVDRVTCRARTWLDRRRFVSLRDAVVHVQACRRARRVRVGPVGKAIDAQRAARREILDLQLALLSVGGVRARYIFR